MEYNINRLTEKVDAYKKVLANTIHFRNEWKGGLKEIIVKMLNDVISKTGLKAKLIHQAQVENLEALILDLGKSSSGLVENVENSDIHQIMIKHNGALIYQQLFNGKVMVMIAVPFIEAYGEPKPPIALEILRPDEIKPLFIIRHLETLLKEITDWEDYDDDQPDKKTIGFQPIGFNNSGPDLETL